MRTALLALVALSGCLRTVALGELQRADPDVNADGDVIEPPDDDPLVPELPALAATCGGAIFDTALPVPTLVTVTTDDHSARLRWNGPLTWVGEDDDDAEGTPDSLQNTGVERVEGYRICWGQSADALEHAMLTTWRLTELRGLPNDTPLVAVIQTVDWEGNVSAPSVPVSFTPSASRIDDLRADMTGFFDDFNQAQGALDERRWNVAFSVCSDPAATATFVGPRHDARSVLANASYLEGAGWGCARPQNVARPRAPFDFSSGQGRIVFDLDGAEGDRHGWRLDLHAFEAGDAPVDITAHALDESDRAHPGRFLRFSQDGDLLTIHQVLADGSVTNEQEATLDPVRRLVPGVMRSWELAVSQDAASISIDGQAVLTNADIALDFSRAQILWTQIGEDPAKKGKPWVSLVWDNFGFDGPPPTHVTHNYKTNHRITEVLDVGTATWTLNIPDSLEGAVSTRLMYVVQADNVSPLAWEPTDTITINGTELQLPEPTSPTGLTWEDQELGSLLSPHSVVMELPPGLVQTGENVFAFSGSGLTLSGLHVEVDFAAGDAPNYTPPSALIAETPVPALLAVGPSVQLTHLDGAVLLPGLLEVENPLTEATFALPDPLNGTHVLQAKVSAHHSMLTTRRNVGVARVELLVDGVVVTSIATQAQVAAPGVSVIELPLDTTTLTDGEHELTVRAYDATGARGRPHYDVAGRANGLDANYEAPIRFTVAN